MEQDKEPTKVIFRKWEKEGDVIALFPEQNGTNDPSTLGSYMHMGQHGSASQDLVRATIPAKAAEYRDLFRELESIGYKLAIIYRCRWAHFESCAREIRRIRG